MRGAGRLKATLGFAQIREILAQDPVQYLRRILGSNAARFTI